MSKLDVALLVGAETKEWLKTVTGLVERLEAAAVKIAGAANAAAPEAATPAPAKGKGKKAAAKKEADPIEKALDEAHEEAAAEEDAADDLDLDMGDDEAADEPTLEDVRKVVKDFATKHGKDKALKLLSKFKVTSIPDIKKADYAKVIELAKKHL